MLAQQRVLGSDVAIALLPWIPGVYYGFKLGEEIPWVSGFPFSVVKHPQYVGSALSVWGVAALLVTQMVTASQATGVVLVAIGWSALYVITGVMEQLF
jgi:methylene-fatty-acyl-phospholipid synthase